MKRRGATRPTGRGPRATAFPAGGVQVPRGYRRRGAKGAAFRVPLAVFAGDRRRLRRIAPGSGRIHIDEETPVIGGKGRGKLFRRRDSTPPRRAACGRPGGRVVEFDVNKPERIRSRSLPTDFRSRATSIPSWETATGTAGSRAWPPRQRRRATRPLRAQQGKAAIGRKRPSKIGQSGNGPPPRVRMALST